MSGLYWSITSTHSTALKGDLGKYRGAAGLHGPSVTILGANWEYWSQTKSQYLPFDGMGLVVAARVGSVSSVPYCDKAAYSKLS